ncbi:uncharacterized protein V6R79_023678 [Siganus canaliculatus]
MHTGCTLPGRVQILSCLQPRPGKFNMKMNVCVEPEELPTGALPPRKHIESDNNLKACACR